MNQLLKLIVATIAVLVADLLLPGVSIGDLNVEDGNWRGLLTALLTAAVLGLLNTFIRPVLILLTLPATILSMGLFILVINAGLVLLADRLVPGFRVDGFWWALGFSLLQWAVQGMLTGMDRRPGEHGPN